MALLELRAGDYAVTVDPAIGGSLRSLSWRGEPLMRMAIGPTVLDAACFPLVPFSNRIANGRFEGEGETITLSPNFPGSDHPHPLHGFGWLAAWDLVESDGQAAVLEHRYPGGEWPWPYLARQTVALSEAGLRLDLTVQNLSDRTMPAGLGFHPYFPRTTETILHALHMGEWQNDADCLPVRLLESEEAIDWWRGQPVGSRPVDTVYVGRQGALRIDWPDRNLQLEMVCDPRLALTAIFVPGAADWFCAEPVSHGTNALNQHGAPDIAVLGPGDEHSVSLNLWARSAALNVKLRSGIN